MQGSFYTVGRFSYNMDLNQQWIKISNAQTIINGFISSDCPVTPKLASVEKIVPGPILEARFVVETERKAAINLPKLI